MRTRDGEFDLFVAKGARDEALTRVAVNAGNFMPIALDAVSQMPQNSLVSGEDIRLRLSRQGIIPHHHNAWGAMIRMAIKKRYLVPIGKHTHMRTKRSHARMTSVYRVT